jgi:hypothetical protein
MSDSKGGPDVAAFFLFAAGGFSAHLLYFNSGLRQGDEVVQVHRGENLQGNAPHIRKEKRS